MGIGKVTLPISGGGGTPPAPTGWARPADWLTMPTVLPTDDVFTGLHAIFPDALNTCAIEFTTSSGQYEVDWGDGAVTLHNSATTAEHLYDYTTYDIPNATLSSRGYKQAIVVVTPVSGDLTAMSFNKRYTGQNQKYVTGWLEVVMSIPHFTTITGILTTSLVSVTLLEQFIARGTVSLTNLSGVFFNIKTIKTVSITECTSVTDMGFMFYGCTSLQTIPLLDTSSVASMGSMFSGCTSLQTIPLLDTSSVASMGSMFSGCTSLQTIPLLDTSSVTDMGGTFGNCTSLQTIPLLDTSSVTNMGSMFYGCTSLQTIPLLDTSSVASMGGTFGNCTSLQTIPLLDTSSVTNMGGAFGNCTSLSSIDVSFKMDIDLSNLRLSTSELVKIFTNLLDRTALAAANINITGNFGAVGLSGPERLIATAKNWTITG